MENTYTPLKNVLESQGKTFSQENLANLAKEQGMVGYTGTDIQNKDLYGKITANTEIKPIALDKLNTPAINVPVTPPSITTTPTNQVESILAQTQVAQTEAQKQAESLANKIATLTPNLQGQTQALADAQRAAGLQELNQNLTDINNQILLKTAEVNQDDIKLAQSLQNIEDKPIAMEFISGQQASVQRNAQLSRALKNAEIGILNARAIGLQGNIALAQETAKQAVELKYTPQREAIATYKAQLEALQPILNTDEKKQAREQELRTKLALNEIEVAQKNEENLQAMIVNAAAQGAPKALIESASKAKTSGQAAMILGQYAGDYYKTELLKNQIATEKAQRSKIYADMAKTNTEANILKAQATVDGKTSDLGTLIKQGKLGEGAKTQVTNVNGVISALKELASSNPTGNLPGINPLNVGFDVFRSADEIKNRGFIDAINLRVQQWASGASLTEDQIKQVNSLVPQKGDTDASAINKANSLADFMNSQLKSILEVNGVQYDPPKSNLFQTQTETNKFQQSLGQPTTPIPGTAIINKINNDGSMDFAVPKQGN